MLVTGKWADCQLRARKRKEECKMIGNFGHVTICSQAAMHRDRIKKQHNIKDASQHTSNNDQDNSSDVITVVEIIVSIAGYPFRRTCPNTMHDDIQTKTSVCAPLCRWYPMLAGERIDISLQRVYPLFRRRILRHMTNKPS